MKHALVIVACLPFTAHADNKSEAVALFQEGLKELKAGNYAQACETLEKSNELHADSGTRGSLAKCYDKLGKVASSWRLWVDLTKTAPVNLRDDAAANAKKLEPRLPKYVIRLGANQPKQIGATIDGQAIDVKPDVEVPIDPGQYTFEANAAGYTGWKYELVAAEGKLVEIEVGLAPVPKVEIKPPPEKPIETPAAPKSSRKKIGIAVGAVGGAFLVGGAVFGIIAKGRNDDAKSICGGDIDRCDPARLGEAQDKVDSARTAGHISTAGFIGGAIAVGVGIALIVTAPTTKTGVAIAPAVGSDSAGFVVRGGF